MNQTFIQKNKNEGRNKLKDNVLARPGSDGQKQVLGVELLQMGGIN